uniref:Putative secreted protein n=1 Tax=Ixodes ricinus TaxID=34613 RepID=A0A147BLQ1_IXORI
MNQLVCLLIQLSHIFLCTSRSSYALKLTNVTATKSSSTVSTSARSGIINTFPSGTFCWGRGAIIASLRGKYR